MKYLLLVVLGIGLVSCGGKSGTGDENDVTNSLLEGYRGDWQTGCVEAVGGTIYIMNSYSIADDQIVVDIGGFEDINCEQFDPDLATALGSLGFVPGNEITFKIDSVSEITTADGFTILKVNLVDGDDVFYLLVLDGNLYDFNLFPMPVIENDDEVVANLYLPYFKQ